MRTLGSFALAAALAFAPAARADRLYVLLTSSFDDNFQAPACGIEIVDTKTMTTVNHFALGNRSPVSLAISPDEKRAYVLDTAWNQRQIAVYDVTSGALTATWPMPMLAQWSVPDAGRDLVLSRDGGHLFVTGYGGFYEFDTSTGALVAQLSTGADTPLGIALSPDGSTLAAASTNGGSDAKTLLVDAATFTAIAAIPMSNGGMYCTVFPTDAAFDDFGHVLLWDSNCDNVYQVDVATRVQLTAATVVMGRDDGTFFNFNNMLQYSPVSHRAYVTQEQGADGDYHLDIIDPVAGTGTQIAYSPSPQGIPFLPALNAAGTTLFVDAIHKFDSGGADTLDSLDTVTGTLTRGVYTFATTFSMPWGTVPGSGRDMHAVSGASPADELAALIAKIEALVAAGALSAGNGNALTSKLANAAASLNGGVTTAACGQLGASANAAAAYTKVGRLAASDGANLAAGMAQLETQLGCR